MKRGTWKVRIGQASNKQKRSVNKFDITFSLKQRRERVIVYD